MKYKFTIKEVKEAYRKLKHHLYYDTTNSLIRKQIAQFEYQGDLDEVFYSLTENLNRFYYKREISPYFQNFQKGFFLFLIVGCYL